MERSVAGCRGACHVRLPANTCQTWTWLARQDGGHAITAPATPPFRLPLHSNCLLPRRAARAGAAAAHVRRAGPGHPAQAAPVVV